MGEANIEKKKRDELLKSLVGHFGKGYASFGAAQSMPKAIPTGHDDLDALLTKGSSGIYLGGIVEVMGSEGSGKCVTKDTYVLTPDGLLTVEEIFRKHRIELNASAGFIECECELVNGSGEIESTSHFYRNHYGFSKNVFAITTKHGFELKGTANHPIKSMDDNGFIVWKRLSQLQPNDVVCIARGNGCFPDVTKVLLSGEVVKSVNEATIIGYLIGDDNFIQDEWIVKDFKRALGIVYGQGVVVKKYGIDYHINNTKFVKAFKSKHGIGTEKACDKTIPETIRCSNREAQRYFIRAYFDADGTFQKNDQNIQFSSCSLQLLRELQLMLLNFGIYSYVTTSHNKTYDNYYELELSGRDLDEYSRCIGFSDSAKCQSIKNSLKGLKKNTNIDVIPNQSENLRSLYESIDPHFRSRESIKLFNDCMIEKCELTYLRLEKFLDGIRKFPKNELIYKHLEDLQRLHYIYTTIAEVSSDTERTYDFTLPESHSFWSNGFISHNTSLALRTVGYAQKLGYLCCWIDAEAAFDENIAVLNGCDPTKLVMPELSDTKAARNDGLAFYNSAEILEMVYKSVCSKLFGMIVLDSVAGLIPDRVLAKDFDPNTVGVAEVARNMSMMLPKIAHACKKTETSVIFINQLREKPGEYYKDRFHTPGGRALKFFSHQRISVEKKGGVEGKVYMEDEEGRKELIGHYARTTIVKNRKAPPIPEGMALEIPIYYREYFPDEAKKCYDLARSLQVITMRQGVLTWKDDNDIILQVDGESGMLAKIREGTLEPRLAAACVVAELSEKNQSRKAPIRIGPSLKELAATYKQDETKPKRSVKKKRRGAIDLDEDNTSI